MLSPYTLTLPPYLSPSALAREVVSTFIRWKFGRSVWEKEMLDIRNTVFASSINTTTNSKNPFQNRTTIPKLTQIFDNLLANYDASLFPNDNWFEYESNSKEASNKDSKKKITGYIRTKARQLKFRSFMRDIIADWILTGMCFVGLDYVEEYAIDSVTGEKLSTYVGPKPYRINPLDVVIDLAGMELSKANKIVRTLKTIGQMENEIKTKPELGYTKELIDRIQERRALFLADDVIFNNNDYVALLADGFSTIQDYYRSGAVEILEYYGDLFLMESGEYFPNNKIIVVDRVEIISNEPIKSWNGSQYIHGCGWRPRPGNLYAQSPLANLLGMQHRLDKIENTKADVFDQIAYPTLIENGDVDYYDGTGLLNGIRGTPGGRYIINGDGSVSTLKPDATALSADFQIDHLKNSMEDLAGAPRNTMGIRTPGEKTAFEVQTLDNAASRIFQNKIAYFEETLLEPLLNDMLEMARRHLNGKDIIKLTDDALGVDTFIDITKDDLAPVGKLHAVGSRYFLRNATIAQNLTSLANSQLYADIRPHVNKIKLAKLFEEVINIDEFDLVQENIGIMQEIESQRLIQAGQQMLEQEQATSPEAPTPGQNEVTQPI